MLKQLEVLKEEEKEFQNLKVRWSLEPASVPNPRRDGVRAPLVTPGRGAAAGGAGNPSLCPPPGRTSSCLSQHCCCRAVCPQAMSPGVVACPRGLSLCRDRGSGLRALFSGPSSFWGMTQRCGASTVGCKGHLCPDLEGAEQSGMLWWHKRTLLDSSVVKSVLQRGAMKMGKGLEGPYEEQLR